MSRHHRRGSILLREVLKLLRLAAGGTALLRRAGDGGTAREINCALS
jgi:hypothetical protein